MLGDFNDKCIINVKEHFNLFKETAWFNDPFVRKVIKEVDKSEVIAGEYIQSPVFVPTDDSSRSFAIDSSDLPGDLCRFIIILKVPYASLKDKLVKAKMELFPSWYKADASNTIIQGIGRGNRSKDDWCVTYIVDGCFGQLYAATKEQYPKELQDRIKVI